jgi:cellulose synthase operon protein C
MRPSATGLAVGLLLSVAFPTWAAVASDPGEQLMLERANFWRTQHQFDRAADLLNKILALNPDQPDALYQKGLLAEAQGDRDTVQQTLDRLRGLASTNQRAAELAIVLAEPSDSSPGAAASGAVITAEASNSSVTPPAQTPSLVVTSADSSDLVPAKASPPTNVSPPPAPRVLGGAALAEAARVQQVAALPQATLSDGDLPRSAATAVQQAGSADLGLTAKTVQVAQVELEPPPPIGGYQQPANVRPYSPSDTLEMDIDRSLVQLEAQTNPELIVGAGVRWHDGASGLNQLTELGLPVQASFSPWYTGTASIAILPVYLDAGSIGTGNLSQFGANPILSAAKLPLSSPGAQTATGVGILGGYSWRDVSGQFGTTPLGFPVTNLVGNLAYVPKFLDGTLSVRIEGLRQPVTDTVLSYAGTHANLSAANAAVPGIFDSNATWGGVVKTGGHVTAFYDNQVYGAYGGAGLASLTGQNVSQNTQLDALLGAYFRPWKGDNWEIRLGIAAYYMSFNKNLGGFTYGQGGYFSPQDFESLTFPVEYTGHDGPWSWLGSVALGVQHFNSSSSPIFPTDPAAQAALASLTTATTFAGAHSVGLAAALRGQIEYAIDGSTSIGAAASYNNGNDYNEVIGKIYLRKTFDWFAPVAIKNDPESIVLRDQPMSHL